MLGEPDEKIIQDESEFWLYDTEHPGRRSYLQTPISFGHTDKAIIGNLNGNRRGQEDQLHKDDALMRIIIIERYR